MNNREPEATLCVEVVDDEIIVSCGWYYSVTYYKPRSMPRLLAKRISETDDARAPMQLTEFLARAWTLANDKARKLG